MTGVIKLYTATTTTLKPMHLPLAFLRKLSGGSVLSGYKLLRLAISLKRFWLLLTITIGVPSSIMRSQGICLVAGKKVQKARYFLSPRLALTLDNYKLLASQFLKYDLLLEKKTPAPIFVVTVGIDRRVGRLLNFKLIKTSRSIVSSQ